MSRPIKKNAITAARIIQTVYNGEKNFMTPNIIRYGWKGEFCYELSKGEGFGGEMMYAVTVVTIDGKKQPMRSTSFSSFAVAESHIKKGLPVVWHEVKRA